ncbi:MAG: glycosyltransferase family 2 protein [Lachnospiraceae bacterium]|nr:glycosyltransferase family 2 protein [Lachnospiraceae bacterium]
MRLNMLVSVVIPIYSVADYLPTCIESVLKQTYSETEIILVDDGSPDNCPTMCDAWAQKDSRIKVIHKKNGGLSDARNAGIENATGDYILFLDGDDYWDDVNALEKLIQRVSLTNADVLNFSFKKYYEDTGDKTSYFHDISDMPLDLQKKKEQLAYLAEKNLYLSSACTKMIRRALFNDNLLFEVGVYSEDVEWSARLIQVAKSMDFICSNFYCYRQRKDSISHTINDKKSKDLCNHIIKCIEMANAASEEDKRLMLQYAAYQYGTYYIVQAQAINEQSECIEKLSNFNSILSNHENSRKLAILHFGTALLGYRRFCKLIRFLYSFRK